MTTKAAPTKRKKPATIPAEKYLQKLAPGFVKKATEEFNKGKLALTLTDRTAIHEITPAALEEVSVLVPLKDGVPDMENKRLCITNWRNQLVYISEPDKVVITAKYSVAAPETYHSIVLTSDGQFSIGCKKKRAWTDATIRTAIGREIGAVLKPDEFEFHVCNCSVCRERDLRALNKYHSTAGTRTYLTYLVWAPLLEAKAKELKELENVHLPS